RSDRDWSSDVCSSDLMASEKFLAKYLGGRAQDGGSPEVVARLQEITVDPKTVVLAKKVDAGTVTSPKPATDLQPGAYKYKAMIEIGRASCRERVEMSA